MKKVIWAFIISFIFTFANIATAAEVILTPTKPATTVTNSSVSETIFTRNLTIGSYGKDVMALKKIISWELFVTLDTSPTFTTNTANDVKKLQEKHRAEILIPSGLSKGTGFVGPATIKKINNLAQTYNIKLGDFVLPTTKPAVPTTVSRTTFTSYLKLGSYGDEVSLLKLVLNSDIDTKIISTSLETNNVFDLATQIAVNKFQEKYANEVLKPTGLTKGTGTVGPATRKKLNYILENIIYPSQNAELPAANTATTTKATPVFIDPYEAYNASQANTQTLPIANKTDSVAPTITFTSETTQIYKGGETTISWNVNNAVDKCKISFKNSDGKTYSSMVDLSGKTAVGPINEPVTYNIICYNKYGIPGTKNLTINVYDLTTKTIQVTTKLPSIKSIYPITGNRGDKVTITGADFLSSNSIYFDGAKIDDSLVLSQSSSTIIFIIPEYKSCTTTYCPILKIDTIVETGGKKLIQVSNSNGFSNDYYVTLPSKIVTIPGTPTVANYTPPKLTVTSIQPTSGNRGDLVTLYGSGFSYDSIVLFGGFKVADNLIVSKTGSSIQFKVPPFQLGCTEPDYEICPRLPIPGTGLILETGGPKNISVMNTVSKSTSTPMIFTLPSKKITY